MVAVENEHKNTAVIYNRNGEHHSRLKSSYDQRFKEAYFKEIDSFADVVLHGSSWSVTRKDVTEVQKVAQAAKEACESNSVVFIPQ